MAAYAQFTAPGGGDGLSAFREELEALTTVTHGDLQYLGQFFRSEILQRTARGVDVNGAPFAPYSTKGPYYFYPNAGSAGSVRGSLAPSDKGLRGAIAEARGTAAKNRHKATGGAGVRTPYGIRYDSYAAAKAAHGGATVNLFGMEQHAHMLNTVLVKVDGQQAPEAPDFGSQLAAHENIAPARGLTIGFYGPEAERAKGNNEGIPGRLPKREFFALNERELEAGSNALAERMRIRAAERRGGSFAPTQINVTVGA